MNVCILGVCSVLLCLANVARFQKVSAAQKTLKGTTIRAAVFEDDVVGANSELLGPADLRQAEANVSYAMDLWIIITHALKFQTKFVLPARSKDNVTDAELRELVTSGVADVVMSPTKYTREIRNVVLSQQVDSTRFKLYIKTISSEFSYTGLAVVFRLELWIAVGVTVVLLAITLVFVTRLGEVNKITSYDDIHLDSGQLVVVIIGNFCYQGAISIASGCGGRIIVFTSLICGWLVYVTYGSLILTELTAVKFQNPFESLQEMSWRGTYKLLIRNDSTLIREVEKVRRDDKHGLYGMWNRLLPKGPNDHLYNDGVRTVRRLCKENVALLDSEERLTATVIRKAECSATPLRPVYFKSWLGFILGANNTYNKLISKTLTRMREAGLISKWRRHWDGIQGLQEQVAESPSSPTSIAINGLIPVLIIYCGGIVLSLVILVLECCYKNYTNMTEAERQRRRFRDYRSPYPFVL